MKKSQPETPSVRAIWIDVDQTLLSFDDCAKEAMEYAFHHTGIEWKEEYFSVFLRENALLWDQIEEGKLTRDELRKIRFGIIFKAIGFPCDVPEEFESLFTQCLYGANHPMPGAREAVEEMSRLNIPLYIVSNGHGPGQTRRLNKAGIGKYFSDVFASADFHAAKPDQRFFQGALKIMNQSLDQPVKPSEIVVIGDSWKADIAGALAFGSRAIWLTANRKHDPFSPQMTDHVYPAESWDEVMLILNQLIAGKEPLTEPDYE